MSGVALATRGMIRPCCKRDQIISYDQPDVQAVLEVRPRIRQAAAPPTVAVTGPVMTGAQELRPVTGAKAPAPASPDPKPAQTSAQELRPIIKKVEED
jgi:hypothetical protein